MADEHKAEFRDLDKYENDMKKSIENLRGKVEDLTNDELGQLLSENVISMRLFKQVYNVLSAEKIRRTGKAGVAVEDDKKNE